MTDFFFNIFVKFTQDLITAVVSSFSLFYNLQLYISKIYLSILLLFFPRKKKHLLFAANKNTGDLSQNSVSYLSILLIMCVWVFPIWDKNNTIKSVLLLSLGAHVCTALFSLFLGVEMLGPRVCLYSTLLLVPISFLRRLYWYTCQAAVNKSSCGSPLASMTGIISLLNFSHFDGFCSQRRIHSPHNSSDPKCVGFSNQEILESSVGIRGMLHDLIQFWPAAWS